MAAAERAAPAGTGRDPRKSNSNRIGSENRATPPTKQARAATKKLAPPTSRASKHDEPEATDGLLVYTRDKLVESDRQRHRGRR
jgi:hypothetical protein